MDVAYPLRERRPRPDPVIWSLRTLHHHHHPVDRVYLVGGWSRHLDPETVTHIPTVQGDDKYDNMVTQIDAILDSDISDDFLLMNDDFFFAQTMGSVPLYDRGPLAAYITTLADGPYRQGLESCLTVLEEWGHVDPPCTAVHTPMPTNKARLSDILDRARSAGHKSGFYRALYGAGMETTTITDPKIRGWSDVPDPEIPLFSTDETSWKGNTGVMVRNRYWRPSPWEAK